MQSCGVHRPSVCPCACKHFLRKSLLLSQKWLDRHQTCTRWSPEETASRLCSRSRSRSKITWYGHFCDFTKIASSRRQMAGTLPSLHMMVPSLACIQGVLKVKVEVKCHVIWALLWCHEMFAIQYGLTFCLYMRSLYQAPLYSPSSISISVYIMEWATPSLAVWFTVTTRNVWRIKVELSLLPNRYSVPSIPIAKHTLLLISTLHFGMCNILKFTQNSLVVLIPYLLTYSQQCFMTTL